MLFWKASTQEVSDAVRVGGLQNAIPLQKLKHVEGDIAGTVELPEHITDAVVVFTSAPDSSASNKSSGSQIRLSTYYNKVLKMKI